MSSYKFEKNMEPHGVIFRAMHSSLHYNEKLLFSCGMNNFSRQKDFSGTDNCILMKDITLVQEIQVGGNIFICYQN
jgi:hypothetical protein